MPSPTQTPVKFCESVRDRSASIENDGETGSKESAVRTFLLEYAEPLDDVRDALHYFELPVINDTYPDAAWMRVQGKTADPIDGWLVFIVTVSYEIPPISSFEGEPTDLPWVFSTDVREIEAILETDFSDEQVDIQNTFGDWFVPPFKDLEYLTIINLSKNIDSWSMANQLLYQNKINTQIVELLGFTFPVHCLFCARFTTSGKQQGNAEGEEYYVLNIQFIFRAERIYSGIDVVDFAEDICNGANKNPNRVINGNYTLPGWDILAIDQGFNAYLSRCSKNIQDKCKDPDGKRVNTLQNLNGFGEQTQHEGSSETYPPVYLPFQVKDDVDFNNIVPTLPAIVP